jgi:hypothetical protein
MDNVETGQDILNDIANSKTFKLSEQLERLPYSRPVDSLQQTPTLQNPRQFRNFVRALPSRWSSFDTICRPKDGIFYLDMDNSRLKGKWMACRAFCKSINIDIQININHQWNNKSKATTPARTPF